MHEYIPCAGRTLQNRPKLLEFSRARKGPTVLQSMVCLVLVLFCETCQTRSPPRTVADIEIVYSKRRPRLKRTSSFPNEKMGVLENILCLLSSEKEQ